MPITFRQDAKYALLVPTSMGLRLTPADGQPFHCSDTFKMQVTSAETNVASIPSLECPSRSSPPLSRTAPSPA